MRTEYVALIALFSVSSCFIYADAQDISFPGATERPSRYPLNPGNPGSRNTRVPNPGMRTTQTPSTPAQGGQSDNTIGGITQQQYNTCVEGCKFTAEYNPQCGSDSVVYQNPGALNCAIYCGNPIQNLGRAPCPETTTASTTTAPTTTTRVSRRTTRRATRRF